MRWARSSAVTPAGRGVHQGSAPWYAFVAIRIFRFPVAALAMVKQAVVASVPFFWNMTQSAWALLSTNLSANSTKRGVGPLKQNILFKFLHF